jgi:hypothetical protein
VAAPVDLFFRPACAVCLPLAACEVMQSSREVRVRTRSAARRLDLTSMALSAGPAWGRPHYERVTCLTWPLGAMVSRWRARFQTLAVDDLPTLTPKAGGVSTRNEGVVAR